MQACVGNNNEAACGKNCQPGGQGVACPVDQEERNEHNLLRESEQHLHHTLADHPLKIRRARLEVRSVTIPRRYCRCWRSMAKLTRCSKAPGKAVHRKEFGQFRLHDEQISIAILTQRTHTTGRRHMTRTLNSYTGIPKIRTRTGYRRALPSKRTRFRNCLRVWPHAT